MNMLLYSMGDEADDIVRSFKLSSDELKKEERSTTRSKLNLTSASLKSATLSSSERNST